MSAPTITTLDCGWLRTQERTLVADGGRDELHLPVASYLIRHPLGTAVFDLGLHPDLVSSDARLGPLAKIFAADLDADGTIGPRLEQHDVDPAGPILAIVSHGHFDHVGGLVDLPNARILVQRDEWRAAIDGDGYDVSLMDLGHDVLELDGAHDVFGDGSVTCIPTPGHTCG
ncbi:MAG: MBL fold metallo-hydrolase, partial [Ilumatobacteraceae bacterium]